MNSKTLTCSFCDKNQYEVNKLIAGSNVAICNECIDLCHDILQSESSDSAGKSSEVKSFTSQEIYNLLNNHVVGQEHAKKVLSVAVSNHYKRIYNPEVEIEKSNILLLGRTGTGKTLLVKTIAKILDVPCVIADATSLTEAGYAGEDVESIILRLLQSCNYNVSKAEKGIVYIDEIDKIARKVDNRAMVRDVSGEGVQQCLLKFMEGTLASITTQGNKKYQQSQVVTVNTENILFICGGTFVDLDNIIISRINKRKMGFIDSANVKANIEKNSVLKYIESNDLVEYGMIPEFLGRLPVIASLEALDIDLLIRILTEPKNSLIKQYQAIFKIDNVKLTFNSDALKQLAEQALTKKLGARALKSILEKLLLDIMFNITNYSNQEIVITKDIVESSLNKVVKITPKTSKKITVKKYQTV